MTVLSGCGLLAERGEGVQRGEHAGVGEPEVAEVVVGAVLAAEHRVVAGHLALDEGVADAGAHAASAGLGDDLGHLGGADHVVDDGDVGGIRTVGDGTSDLAAGDERGDGAGAHRFSALVDDEAAVGVTVEGQAEVGAVLPDGGLQVDEVLGVERVGLVVGEAAVELEVERDDGERKGRQAGAGLEHGRDRVAAHAVAGVDDDLEVPDAGEVDQGAQEGRRSRAGGRAPRGCRSGRSGVGRGRVGSVVGRRARHRRGCARRGRGRRRGRCPGRRDGPRRGTS